MAQPFPNPDDDLTRWLALRLDSDARDVSIELRTIRAVQDEHSAILRRNTDLLRQHGITLDEHTAILRRHSEILEQHSEILEQHGATLDSHSDKLVEHTARFDSVDAQLQELTRMVGQVLRRLPGDDVDES